jgi:hypothetical protein
MANAFGTVQGWKYAAANAAPNLDKHPTSAITADDPAGWLKLFPIDVSQIPLTMLKQIYTSCLTNQQRNVLESTDDRVRTMFGGLRSWGLISGMYSAPGVKEFTQPEPDENWMHMSIMESGVFRDALALARRPRLHIGVVFAASHGFLVSNHHLANHQVDYVNNFMRACAGNQSIVGMLNKNDVAALSYIGIHAFSVQLVIAFTAYARYHFVVPGALAIRSTTYGPVVGRCRLVANSLKPLIAGEFFDIVRHPSTESVEMAISLFEQVLPSHRLYYPYSQYLYGRSSMIPSSVMKNLEDLSAFATAIAYLFPDSSYTKSIAFYKSIEANLVCYPYAQLSIRSWATGVRAFYRNRTAMKMANYGVMQAITDRKELQEAQRKAGVTVGTSGINQV